MYWSFRKSSFGMISNGRTLNEFPRSRSLSLNHDRFDHRVDGSVLVDPVIPQVGDDREALSNRSMSVTSGLPSGQLGHVSTVDGLRGEERIFP